MNLYSRQGTQDLIILRVQGFIAERNVYLRQVMLTISRGHLVYGEAMSLTQPVTSSWKHLSRLLPIIAIFFKAETYLKVLVHCMKLILEI